MPAWSRSSSEPFRLPITGAGAFEQALGRGLGASPDALGHNREAGGGSTVFGESWAGTKKHAFFRFLLVVP